MRRFELFQEDCTVDGVHCDNILTVNVLMCIAGDTTSTRNNRNSMDIFSFNYTDASEALSMKSLKVMSMTNEPASRDFLNRVYNRKLNEQIITASNQYIVLTLSEEEMKSIGHPKVTNVRGMTKLRLRPVWTLCSDEIGMRYMISTGDDNCSMWFEMRNEERSEEFRCDPDITRYDNVKPFEEILISF